MASTLGRWRRLGLLMVAAAGLVTVAPTPAYAHGERAQEAFVRMRSAVFFDVAFSTHHIKVGDPVVVTGKVKVLDAWPEHFGDPHTGEIGVAQPGSVLIRTDTLVNGVDAPGSIQIEKGGVYEFKITLRGRLSGDWHVHPRLAVQGRGSLLGPGEWVRVDRSDHAFKNNVKLVKGGTVNLENYGFGTVVLWTVITFLLGAAWLVYWLIRPLIQRAPLVASGLAEGELVTARDKRVGIGFLVVALAMVGGGLAYTSSRHYAEIPLQPSKVKPPALEQAASRVQIAVKETRWDPQADSLTIKLQATNKGDVPLQPSELSVANFTFSTRPSGQPHHSERAVGQGGGGTRPMLVDPAVPVGAGETRELTITLADHIWEEEGLMPVKEAQIVFAGLLFFSGDGGTRTFTEVFSPVIPKFA